MQLVGGGVEMLDPMKNKRIDRDGVIEKFGVGPERVIDVQALAGIRSTTCRARRASGSRLRRS
jgi:5'-3' exonuclease